MRLPLLLCVLLAAGCVAPLARHAERLTVRGSTTSRVDASLFGRATSDSPTREAVLARHALVEAGLEHVTASEVRALVASSLSWVDWLTTRRERNESAERAIDDTMAVLMRREADPSGARIDAVWADAMAERWGIRDDCPRDASLLSAMAFIVRSAEYRVEIDGPVVNNAGTCRTARRSGVLELVMRPPGSNERAMGGCVGQSRECESDEPGVPLRAYLMWGWITEAVLEWRGDGWTVTEYGETIVDISTYERG